MKSNYIGQKFNRLTVLSYDNTYNGTKNTMYNCICECGNYTRVLGFLLKTNKTMSCGCYNKEIITKHGKNKTIEYRVWAQMKDRCNNKNSKSYIKYGAKGIKVCDRWNSSFEYFLKDMGLRPSNNHSIDRINSKGNYEPSNCRWADIEQQNNNRSCNVFYEADDKKLTVPQWARELNTTIDKIKYFLKHKGDFQTFYNNNLNKKND